MSMFIKLCVLKNEKNKFDNYLSITAGDFSPRQVYFE